MIGRFEEEEVPRIQAVVTIFDLEGFTTFCIQPQAELRVPAFLNLTLEVICSCLDPTWRKGENYDFRFEQKPDHVKFLGDGGLVVWRLPSGTEEQSSYVSRLVSGLYIARATFADEAQQFGERFGLVGYPKRLRFGVATGEILRLNTNVGREEYVGFPINLASRLQGYCKSLGFIVSARAGVREDTLEETGLKLVEAKNLTGLKGFVEAEKVLVDSVDFDKLPVNESSNLFSEL